MILHYNSENFSIENNENSEEKHKMKSNLLSIKLFNIQILDNFQYLKN